MVAAKDIAQKIPAPTPVKATQREAADLAQAIYKELSPAFERSRGVSLAKALTKIKELQLDSKKSKLEKKKRKKGQLETNKS